MIVLVLILWGLAVILVITGNVLATFCRRDGMSVGALLLAGRDLAVHPERYVRDGWQGSS